ncbi:hypothetical protein [Streptomyces chartreusis]|uniref:hypothetical protein n=1 Tax=Streptomyces chartreusis TaxID=1969 RepID=UPI00362980AE
MNTQHAWGFSGVPAFDLRSPGLGGRVPGLNTEGVDPPGEVELVAVQFDCGSGVLARNDTGDQQRVGAVVSQTR